MKKSLNYLALLTSTAFAPTNVWKTDADGKIELKDGNPVYLDASGREMTVDGGTITRLNNEARQHREVAATALEKLKAFEIDGKLIDAETARKALDTVKNIDAKKLIDAGEVEKVRNEISQQFTAQLAEKDKAIGDLQSRYDNSQIANIFGNSDFIRNRVAVPPEMFQAYFAQNVRMVNGQPEFYDRAGNRLLSKTKIGEAADASEAFELLVDAHPQKDLILKANDASGSGSNGNGGNRGGGRTVKRADFDKYNPQQKAEAAAKMASGEISIVD